MEHLKEIRKLEDVVWKNMGKCLQITIDMVQNTEMQLNREEHDEAIQRDEVGAIVYKISTLLEAFNPDRKLDIEILNKLKSILERWEKDIEFVNRALGIPIHAG